MNTEWTSVTARLPEDRRKVLVTCIASSAGFNSRPFVMISRLARGTQFECEKGVGFPFAFFRRTVTHWQDLPKPVELKRPPPPAKNP